MRIGFLHNDRWPLKDGSSIQSWQIYQQLRSRYDVAVPYFCPFPSAKISYFGKQSIFSFVKDLDLLFIIVDGQFQLEKFSILALLKPGKLKVIWLVNAPIEESLVYPGRSKFIYNIEKQERKLLSHFVDAGISISEELKPYLNHELAIKNIRVIPNGTDPAHFNPATTPQALISGMKGYYKVVWSGVGYLPWQALDILHKVATKMAKIDKNIVFFVLSDQTWVDLGGLDNVVSLRSVNYQYLPKWINSADICLCLYHPYVKDSPYGFYGSPMKLFDYLSMSKPVIASNYGQIKAVINDRHNGLLTNNSPADIVRKILYCKNHPAICGKMGVAARKTVLSRYNWDRVGYQIYELISALF